MQYVIRRGREIRDALQKAGLTGDDLEQQAHTLHAALNRDHEIVWWPAKGEPLRFVDYRLDDYRQQPAMRKVPWLRYSVHDALHIPAAETFLDFFVEAEPVPPSFHNPAPQERAIAVQIKGRIR